MLLANGSPVDIAGWKDQLEEKGLQADLKTFIQEVKNTNYPILYL